MSLDAGTLAEWKLKRHKRLEAAWSDWVLFAAVVLGLAWSSNNTYIQWAHMGLVWVLGFAWLFLRRHAILGSQPGLVMWIVVIAAVAGNRPLLGFGRLDLYGLTVSAAACAAAVFWAVRRPTSFGRVLLQIGAFWCVAAGIVVLCLVILGVIAGNPGRSWSIYGLPVKANALGNTIVALVWLGHIVLGVVLKRWADRLKPGSQ